MKKRLTLTLDIDVEVRKSVEYLQSQCKQFIAAQSTIIAQFYQVLNRAYQLADCPHGDTHEGLLKWVAETPVVKNAQEEIEHQIQDLASRIRFPDFDFEGRYQTKVEMDEDELSDAD